MNSIYKFSIIQIYYYTKTFFQDKMCHKNNRIDQFLTLLENFPYFDQY